MARLALYFVGMQSEPEPTIDRIAREMAKLYKTLGPREVARLVGNARIDHLLPWAELDPLHITTDGLTWMYDAQRLIAPELRESVSLDDLSLAFEATYKPSDLGWVARRDRRIFVQPQTEREAEALRNRRIWGNCMPMHPRRGR